jgi:hypothetical protein
MSTLSTPPGAASAVPVMTVPVMTVPVITVASGEATPAELAAVLAVLLAARSAAPAVPAAQRPPAPRWAERSRARAAFPRPGQHAWRASALPHR